MCPATACGGTAANRNKASSIGGTAGFLNQQGKLNLCVLEANCPSQVIQINFQIEWEVYYKVNGKKKKSPNLNLHIFKNSGNHRKYLEFMETPLFSQTLFRFPIAWLRFQVFFWGFKFLFRKYAHLLPKPGRPFLLFPYGPAGVWHTLALKAALE